MCQTVYACCTLCKASNFCQGPAVEAEDALLQKQPVKRLCRSRKRLHILTEAVRGKSGRKNRCIVGKSPWPLHFGGDVAFAAFLVGFVAQTHLHTSPALGAWSNNIL